MSYLDDHIKIVEYYPVSFKMEPSRSTLTIRSRAFKRYVFRSISGNDILMSQILGAYRLQHVEHVTENWFGDTQDELFRHIGYDLYDYLNKNWAPLAAKVSAYVYDNDAEGEHFRLEIEEGEGELHVTDERYELPDSTMRDANNRQRATDTCVICQENLSNEVSTRLGMKCGHVFHKECLAEWIWTKPHCPICREAV